MSATSVADRRSQRRGQILAAAWDIAAESGLAAVSLHEVARRVGIRQPSLYGYVSSKHATITVADGALAVKDLGSANGTFVRINGHAPVNPGDLLLVGEQILRVDPA